MSSDRKLFFEIPIWLLFISYFFFLFISSMFSLLSFGSSTLRKGKHKVTIFMFVHFSPNRFSFRKKILLFLLRFDIAFFSQFSSRSKNEGKFPFNSVHKYLQTSLSLFISFAFIRSHFSYLFCLYSFDESYLFIYFHIKCH